MVNINKFHTHTHVLIPIVESASQKSSRISFRCCHTIDNQSNNSNRSPPSTLTTTTNYVSTKGSTWKDKIRIKTQKLENSTVLTQFEFDSNSVYASGTCLTVHCTVCHLQTLVATLIQKRNGNDKLWLTTRQCQCLVTKMTERSFVLAERQTDRHIHRTHMTDRQANR